MHLRPARVERLGFSHMPRPGRLAEAVGVPSRGAQGREVCWASRGLERSPGAPAAEGGQVCRECRARSRPCVRCS